MNTSLKKENQHPIIDDKLIRQKKIAIVGGGPSGLPLAKLLQMRGCADVTVYEREKSRHYRIQGSSLDLHSDSGLKVVKAANLMEEFMRLIHPDGEATAILDKYGNVKFAVPALKIFQSRPEIDRGDLRDLFLDSLNPETVQWDYHFVSMTSVNENQYELIFENGKKIVADLVIGADGSNSKIRPFVTEITPKYSGTLMIQGHVDNPEEKCPRIFNWVNKGMMIALGAEKAFTVHQMRDCSLIFYVSDRQPEDYIKTSGLDFSSSKQVKNYLKTILADWDSAFVQLIDAANGMFIPRQLYGCPVDQHWETKQNLTIIGDAAHVMPPFAGQGANMAMLDALELVDCLTSGKYSDIRTALGAYEAQMFKRTGIAAKETEEGELAFHSPRAIEDIFKLFFGRYSFVRHLIPPLLHSINFITDLLGLTKKN